MQGSRAAASRRQPRDVPWWARLFFWVPVPEGIEARHWAVLGALGTSYLVNSYDTGVINLALPQVQQSFGLSEDAIGKLAALIRLGVLPALAAGLAADRIGRRRLLLATIVGFTVCTFLTAFARTATEFAVLQFLARGFVYAEDMLAIVVVTEELAPRARGWGVGMLVAFGALGHGLSALAFAGVNATPFGWRALYFLGVLPLALVAWMRRSVQETDRFLAASEKARTRKAWAPLGSILRHHPGRLLALSAAIAPMAFVAGTALQFQSKFLQEAHGWTPGQVSMLFLGGGPLAMTGGLLCGKASDRFGRRRVLSAAILANVAATLAFYLGHGLVVPLVWVVTVFTQFGVDVLFAALGSELFPTSQRSTASSLRTIVATVSVAAGLALEGSLHAVFGSHGEAIAAMSLVALASPFVLLWLVPETSGLPLEEIAPDLD